MQIVLKNGETFYLSFKHRKPCKVDNQYKVIDHDGYQSGTTCQIFTGTDVNSLSLAFGQAKIHPKDLRKFDRSKGRKHALADMLSRSEFTKHYKTQIWNSYHTICPFKK